MLVGVPVPTADLELLRAFVRELFPAHLAQPPTSLEPAAPAAIRAIWAAIGESPVLAPHGLARDALADRIARTFAGWRGKAEAELARFPATTRWLWARADGVDFVDDEHPDPDPQVLRRREGDPQPRPLGRRYSEWVIDDLVARVARERRATLWFGSPLDDGLVTPLASSPRLRRLGSVWIHDAPAERVLTRLGATSLFPRFADWVALAVQTPAEQRPWLRPPTTPALGLSRARTPASVLALLDPQHPTPTDADTLALTPAFERADVERPGPQASLRMLPWPSRVGTLAGLPVWIYAPGDPYDSDDDIFVFHASDQREPVRAALERLGATVEWMIGDDLEDEP